MTSFNIGTTPKKKATTGLLIGAGGSGKAQPLDEPILTPSGWSTMGAIAIGDYVIDETGNPVMVIDTFYNSSLEMYNIKFSDNSSTRCCIDHLWKVQTRKRRVTGSHIIMTTKDIIDGMTVRKHSKEQHKYSVMLPSPVNFPDRVLLVDPWEMGYILGNGSSSPKKSTLDITIGGHDIEHILENFNNDYIKSVTYKSSGVVVIRVSMPCRKNYNSYGLLGVKSVDKWIPKEYLLGSIDQRKKLLSGLIDSDGSCTENRASFSTSSYRMAIDFQSLVRSLGGIANIYSSDNICKKNAEYIVQFRTPFNPFGMPRKAIGYTVRKNDIVANKRIISIEYVGNMPGKCIMLNSESHLYLTKDYTVTHNTGIAYHAPNPFFLVTDKCTSWIDKPRFIDNEGLTESCKTFDEFIEKLRFVAKSENITSQGVEYHTLVIDSLTALEDLIFADIVSRSPKIKLNGIMQSPSCIDEMGYTGRGLVMPYWVKLLNACSIINNTGVDVVLIAHTTLKNAAGESLEAYKMHDMTLQAFGAHNVPDLLKRSVDWCFFVSSIDETVSNRGKAVGSANQVLTTVRTRPTSLFFAKAQGSRVEEIQHEYTFTADDRKEVCEKMFADIRKANSIA